MISILMSFNQNEHVGQIVKRVLERAEKEQNTKYDKIACFV
jgi:hypothetical protein